MGSRRCSCLPDVFAQTLAAPGASSAQAAPAEVAPAQSIAVVDGAGEAAAGGSSVAETAAAGVHTVILYLRWTSNSVCLCVYVHVYALERH